MRKRSASRVKLTPRLLRMPAQLALTRTTLIKNLFLTAGAVVLSRKTLQLRRLYFGLPMLQSGKLPRRSRI